MQDIDSFLPDLLTLVPNCPDILAYRWLREAAGDVCTRTKGWRERDSFTISAADNVGVCTIGDASIVEIQNARLDETELEPKIPEWLDEKHPDWQDDENEGTAQYITQTAADTVSIYPRAGGTLKVRLVLKPSRSAMRLPDFLWEHHSMLVAKGAAAYLLIQPKTDFENPQLGAAYRADFTSALEGIVRKTRRGQQAAPVRTIARFF